jgi:hypothetical protein
MLVGLVLMLVHLLLVIVMFVSVRGLILVLIKVGWVMSGCLFSFVTFAGLMMVVKYEG